MLEKVALKAMLKYIEFEVVSKCCPVCGGNQYHDSACVLAAFLYLEKAESYKYNTHDTHINEMLWRISNDERFAFLRNELAVAQGRGLTPRAADAASLSSAETLGDSSRRG